MTLAMVGAPPSQRGSVAGTFSAFIDLGFGLGPITLGVIAAHFGYADAFLASGLVALAGLALLRLTRRSLGGGQPAA